MKATPIKTKKLIYLCRHNYKTYSGGQALVQYLPASRLVLASQIT